MPLFKPNIAALKDKHDTAGLLNLLKTNDARTRVNVLKALGDLRDAKTVPAIIDVLLTAQEHVDVQIEAAIALGKIGAVSAIDALLQATTQSRQREQYLIDYALQADDRRYRPNLYINRISTDELNLRAAIAHALAHIGSERAVPSLFEMLASETGAMEKSAKRAIQTALTQAIENLGASALPVVCDALAHSASEVRQWAAQCLGSFENEQAADALLRVAYNNEENFEVREAALASLGKVGDARAIPYLEDLMYSENRNLVRDAKQCAMVIRARMKAKKAENE